MGRASDAKERLMKAVSELIWTGSYGTTTIDQICLKSGVKKGSFYYFFDSKASVAEAALEVEWQHYRAQLDSIFSPTIPPLRRLRDYCDFGLQEQVALKKKHGYVLGCPLCTVGAEVSTQERGLRRKVEFIMNQSLLFLETAIRDAHAAGLVEAPDAAVKARIVHAYCAGLMTQARIQNKIEVLREMADGVFAILGATNDRLMSAG